MKDAIGQIICWKCQRGTGKNFQLLNVKLDSFNKKTGELIKSSDYICKDCKDQGFLKPEIWNTSFRKFPTKEEIEEMMKRMQELSESSGTPEDEATPPNIPFVDGVSVKEHVDVQITQ